MSARGGCGGKRLRWQVGRGPWAVWAAERKSTSRGEHLAEWTLWASKASKASGAHAHLPRIVALAAGQHGATIVGAADDVEGAIGADARAASRAARGHRRQQLRLAHAAHVEALDRVLVADAARIAAAAEERRIAPVGREGEAAARLQHLARRLPLSHRPRWRQQLAAIAAAAAIVRDV